MKRLFPRIFLLFLSIALAATVRPAEAVDAPKEGILLAAFGTTVPEAMSVYTDIEQTFKAEFPGSSVEWAYTSQIIRRKLEKQGRPVGGVSDGLAALAARGVKVVRVQSLHIMAGEEFAELARAVLIDVQKNPGRFNAVYLGRPLLESRQDALEAAAALVGDTKKAGGEALVFMGHGQSQGRADLVFEGVRAVFREIDPRFFMATAEGARNFDRLLRDLKSGKVRRVRLQALMLVAGEHARNDLAGDEKDSWASRLKAAGFQIKADLHGLGEMDGIRSIFVRHAKESGDDLTKEPKKQ
ncbi:sirohydrochlorin cobaltochelatase CbiKP [Deltaproteobacteria bacterium]|nr:sirohydrochlorin cobaltochelatase CbiKP [Deltaproteobacteria bacterium]